MSFQDLQKVLDSTFRTAKELSDLTGVPINTARENLRRAYFRGMVDRKKYYNGFAYRRIDDD